MASDAQKKANKAIKAAGGKRRLAVKIDGKRVATFSGQKAVKEAKKKGS